MSAGVTARRARQMYEEAMPKPEYVQAMKSSSSRRRYRAQRMHDSRFAGFCRLRTLESAVPSSTGSKVLLVEDSKFLRLANERVLTKAGYEVCTAEDGEAALRLANEKRPDVILLDMMLPKLSGPEVLRALKKDPLTTSIPVIVLTSLSQKNEEKLLGEGAEAYFEKSSLDLDKIPIGWLRQSRRY